MCHRRSSHVVTHARDTTAPNILNIMVAIRHHFRKGKRRLPVTELLNQNSKSSIAKIENLEIGNQGTEYKRWDSGIWFLISGLGNSYFKVAVTTSWFRKPKLEIRGPTSGFKGWAFEGLLSKSVLPNACSEREAPRAGFRNWNFETRIPKSEFSNPRANAVVARGIFDLGILVGVFDAAISNSKAPIQTL